MGSRTRGPMSGACRRSRGRRRTSGWCALTIVTPPAWRGTTSSAGATARCTTRCGVRMSLSRPPRQSSRRIVVCPSQRRSGLRSRLKSWALSGSPAASTVSSSRGSSWSSCSTPGAAQCSTAVGAPRFSARMSSESSAAAALSPAAGPLVVRLLRVCSQCQRRRCQPPAACRQPRTPARRSLQDGERTRHLPSRWRRRQQWHRRRRSAACRPEAPGGRVWNSSGAPRM
mmetsp:Transcript_87371/g.244535  ORF Transcript_87371/g.244535 Transcript_87371/m.244535 type:complete len:228 (+) Transcript_87371:284-967(+)